MVMVPITLMVLAAILGVMWKSTQMAKSITHTLELTYSNELTAITLQLVTLKNSIDRIEKLISETVLFGSTGRSAK